MWINGRLNLDVRLQYVPALQAELLYFRKGSSPVVKRLII